MATSHATQLFFTLLSFPRTHLGNTTPLNASPGACRRDPAARDAGIVTYDASPQMVKRPVSSVRRKKVLAPGQENSSSNCPSQTWVRTPADVDFVTDPNGLEEAVESVSSSRASSPSGSTDSPGDTYLVNPDLEDSCFQDDLQAQESVVAAETAISGLLGISHLPPTTEAVVEARWHEQDTGNSGIYSHPNEDLLLQLETLVRSPLNLLGGTSFARNSPASQTSASSSTSNVQLTSREANLFRNYIENISLWIDAGDPLNHFGTVVPQRALRHPILLLSIFAVSGLHLSLVSSYDETEGAHYYSECISLLIPTISQMEENCDENVLAALVLLRSYEEKCVEDNRCHLLGSTRLLNSITTFSSSGGLGEAASWVILREVIYISVVSKEPISIRLENYEQSHSFLKENDYSWTNIMVFLFAKVLSIAFMPQENVSTEDWLELETAIEEWNNSKPASFNPLIVGVQHYHLAKIFIQAYKPMTARPGFDFLRANRERENSIKSNVGIILGLALGNPKVQNGWFTTSHTLSAYGCYLRSEEERQVALQFLEDMDKAMGWKCQSIASLLRQQWTTLDESCGRSSYKYLLASEEKESQSREPGCKHGASSLCHPFLSVTAL
ncbi:uncharacterized protein PAC_04808 [Phialocephala subalpina]|uniref:ARCA protein n=1 Tax=Phialocephala subalpina TaxID=576137 RepID=A0A1L7WQ71_9HELO|nr:uncharacterized protein PAC_04808 [Phialocephala subalpina]